MSRAGHASPDVRRELLAIERVCIELAWLTKCGRPPTDAELTAIRPTFLRAHAGYAEQEGRPDLADVFRRFAALVGREDHDA